MSSTISSLTEVANDTLELIGRIRAVEQSGQDQKTDEIEGAALALIEKLRTASQEAAQPAQSATAEVRDLLNAQRAVLEARLGAPDLTLDEFTALTSEVSSIDFKLFIMGIDQTLTWDTLLSAGELEMFERVLTEAADQVRRRRRLQRIIQSLTSVFTTALNLTSKVVSLVT